MTIERRMLPKVQPRKLREPKTVKRPADTGPSREAREQVKDRARLCCERCGIWAPPTVGEIHHRRNRSQGLDNSVSNLVLLCRDCHSWVGARPKAAHAEGFHLERGDVPEETKLFYGGPHVQEYGRRWARLREDGEVVLISRGNPAPVVSDWGGTEVLS